MRSLAVDQQGHVGSKTLLQQDPPVLNRECRLTQIILYNDDDDDEWICRARHK